MQLIADSGSTKTTWCVAEKGSVVARIQTGGMNPFFQSEKEMQRLITEELFPKVGHCAIRQIFFYGAGCAFPAQTEAVRRTLLSVWNEAKVEVEVESDLVGAARSLCGNEAGIACILGTGSNSCLYDGHGIRKQVSPLGFILGDEGSGAVLGKLLVGDCLKGQLPPEISRSFFEEYRLTAQEILDRVYRQPFPNRFLASLSPFLAKHLAVPEIRSIVFGNFQRFFRRNVMAYEGHDRLPVHFTGSVAYYYRPLLSEAAASLGIRLGNVVRDPMDGLIRFHASEDEVLLHSNSL